MRDCIVECVGIYRSFLDWILISMRISAFFVTFFAVLAGVAGYYLRLSELANVFDAITGLPDRNAATTFWLIMLSVAVMICVLVFAIRVTIKYKALPGFENAFGTDPTAYPIIFILVGISWLVGTYLYFSGLNAYGAVTVNDISFIAFSAIAAISTTFFAIEMYQDSRRNAPYALSIVPTLFLCFWLIFIYRQNASNPVLLSYAYQCLAVVASALSFYFTSGFLYGKPAPGKATITYCAAIFFGIVTLADDHPIGIKLIFVALIAANIVYSSLLLRNLQRK